MHRTPFRRHAALEGFSLLELVVVLSLAGVLLGIVAPRLLGFRREMVLDSAAHELARDLGRARMEAVKRNEAVSLRRLADTAYQIGAHPLRRLPAGVTFKTSGSVDSVRFAALGPVVIGAGNLTIAAGEVERTVRVRASGQVVVQ